MRLLHLAVAAALAPLSMADCGAAPSAIPYVRGPAGQALKAPPEEPQEKSKQKSQDRKIRLVMVNGGKPPANDWDIQVALGGVPGDLMGRPGEVPPLLIRAAFGQEFTLSLPAVERALAPHAAPAAPALLAAGLVVKPSGTRFLRVATSIQNKKTKRIVLGGGFKPVDAEAAILAYFDRACTLQGRVTRQGQVSDISLQIPAPGLYWLDARTVSPGVTRYRNAQPGLVLQFTAM